MHYYCTLFDYNYFPLGLALYRSLVKQYINDDFRLYVLCMDKHTYNILNKMHLKNIVLIRLDEFENNQLKAVKKIRTKGEYCWTCTSSLMSYIFNRYKSIGHLAYLDADLFFFSHPKAIFNEFIGASILITPHRFSWSKRFYAKEAGKYNVSLVLIRNDEEGRKCLSEWRDDCLAWCYSRYEDGKYGDQLYLNKWPKKFKHVRVLKNIGAGLAPWNVDRYKLIKIKHYIYVENKPLIFYHFHQFRINVDNKIILTKDYILPPLAREFIYQPYKKEVLKIILELKQHA